MVVAARAFGPHTRVMGARQPRCSNSAGPASDESSTGTSQREERKRLTRTGRRRARQRSRRHLAREGRTAGAKRWGRGSGRRVSPSWPTRPSARSPSVRPPSKEGGAHRARACRAGARARPSFVRRLVAGSGRGRGRGSWWLFDLSAARPARVPPPLSIRPPAEDRRPSVPTTTASSLPDPPLALVPYPAPSRPPEDPTHGRRHDAWARDQYRSRSRRPGTRRSRRRSTSSSRVRRPLSLSTATSPSPKSELIRVVACSLPPLHTSCPNTRPPAPAAAG